MIQNYIHHNMKQVLEYVSYRDYLRDYYQERKARSGFTWRDFAKAAGYSSPVFLKLVCDGKANLSDVGTERVAAAIGLAGVELQYFRLMVNFDQTKDSLIKRSLYNSMRALAKDNSMEVMGEEAYVYYEDWLNPVLREMAPRMHGASPTKMAGQCVFPADAQSVKQSLDLLVKTGLLQKDEKGEYQKSSKSVTTGIRDGESMAIREMHRQMGDLAVKSLDQVSMDERDVSGMTIGISKEGFFRIKNEIADFRRRIAAIVMEDDDDDRIYRLNLQLFPLTKPAK